MKPPCPLCGLDRHPPRGCNARKRSGKHSPRPLLSFDCETVTGRGIVLFLASGTDRAAASYCEPAAGEGLTLETILPWIIEAGRGRLCFGFFFDYDVNQIVGLLPDAHKAQIAARGRVLYGRWRLQHTPGKRFSVGDTLSGQSATIWDCSGWAQCSFAKLAEDWQLGTESERALVRAMKERREDFANATPAELVQYTTLECALLTEWVERLIRLHDDCGIHLRAYSGPGSTAGAMVRQRGWKPPVVPPDVELIAEAAFFGGRSEISSVGPVAGPIHSYDINSAYPTAIAGLPEIANARWFRARRFVPGAFGFYRVRWHQRSTAPWGLFPIRGAMLPTGRKSVSLLYPTHGVGWFHSYEVATALEIEAGAVEILDARLIEPRGVPFDWIRETTTERLKYKAAGDARAFPLKVGCNSIYGKLAQHSGSHPLQCLTYAAAVTAHTRAQLLRVAHAHGHNVILLATDGILATVPLPECARGSGLGEWEYQEYDSAWLLQAGVYWAGGKKRTRGIDARGLHLADVEREWARRRTRGEIVLQARRVLSYRVCAAQNKLPLTGTWCESTRTVRFNPAPRRRGYRWRGARLLTVPARIDEYKAAALVDSLALSLDAGAAYDELDGMPDWAYQD